MLKKYKNRIFEVIKEFNLDTQKFFIDEGQLYDDDTTTTLELHNSPLYFYFTHSRKSWHDFKVSYKCFQPLYPLTEEYPLAKSEYCSFAECISILKNWLQDHIIPFLLDDELNDKWNSFNFETRIYELAQIDLGDNSNFSHQEIEQIQKSLYALKAEILDEFKPTNLQLDYINKRIDYLIHSSQTLGKFDWTNTFISIMISIAINMCVDTETGKRFFEIIKNVFNLWKGFLYY